MIITLINTGGDVHTPGRVFLGEGNKNRNQFICGDPSALTSTAGFRERLAVETGQSCCYNLSSESITVPQKDRKQRREVRTFWYCQKFYGKNERYFTAEIAEVAEGEGTEKEFNVL